jgi:hypothetical protein
MRALKNIAVIGTLAALIPSILLGGAGLAYAAHQAQAYCLDRHASIDDEALRRPRSLDCRPIVLDDWSDSWQNLVPADDRRRPS